MFCSNCGARLVAGSANCPTCDTKVASDLPVPPPPPGAYPPPAAYRPPGLYPPAAYPPGAYSDKSKVVAGLLQIFLGAFGVGRFYTGYTTIAILQIVVTWVTCGFGALWPFVDGILMLVGKVPDSEGRPLRD